MARQVWIDSSGQGRNPRALAVNLEVDWSDWTPKGPPASATPTPPADTRYRSVRDEHAGMALAAIVGSAACAVAAVVHGSSDAALAMSASFVGGMIGIGLIMAFMPVVPAKYLDPVPLPDRPRIDSPRRTVVSTFCVIILSVAAVAGVFALLSADVGDVLPVWAGTYAAMGLSWVIKWRRFGALQASRQFELFRDVATVRRLRRSKHIIYALPRGGRLR